MTEEIFVILTHCISAVLIWIISYSFFEENINRANGRRNFIFKEYIQNEVLLLGIKVFESIALAELPKRLPPLTLQAKARKHLLTSIFEQEYDSNLSQKIYISGSCWINALAYKNNSLQNNSSFESKLVFLIKNLGFLLLPEVLKSKVRLVLAVPFLKIKV